MRTPIFKDNKLLSHKRLVNVLTVGDKFNNWTVKSASEKKDYVTCECVCGVIRDVHVYSLKSNKSKSCGCRRKK